MSAPNSTPVCKVLLVDDSDDDRFLLRRRLRGQPQFQIVAELSNGRDAIAYLSGVAGLSNRARFPFPDLLLLDLKMPHMTGFEILEWLQTQAFAGLKIVVLSGSPLPQDIARSLELGAHAYHVKDARPADEPALLEKLRAVLAGDLSCRFAPKPPKTGSIAIFVRHKETHEFLSAKGEWVSHEEAATRFESPRHASEVSKKLGVRNAEIVMRYPMGRSDLKIDLPWG